MKTIVFLSSSSNETDKYAAGLAALGWGAVDVLRYDVPGASDQRLYEQVKGSEPGVIVYVGSRWGPQVSTHMLSRMNFTLAPTIHFCSDAADPPWWDLLREYHQGAAFALQVAIDGNKQWPLADSQMTALTPVDPACFTAVNGHAGRSKACCYAGNPGAEGSPRRSLLSELAFRQAITVRLRDGSLESYPAYCGYLMDSRISLNVPLTGTGAAMHVKGRVVESGLAGCLLLEAAGSPTRDWFEPGVDYLEFNGAGEALELIERYRDRPEESERFGARLRAKVLARHTPAAFWRSAFQRAGVRVPMAEIERQKLKHKRKRARRR